MLPEIDVDNADELSDPLTKQRPTPPPEPELEPEDDGAPAKRNTEEWKEAFKELSTTIKKGFEKPEVVKELTPDQINEKWGVFDPEKADKDFFKNLFNLPDDVDPKILERIKKAWAMQHQGMMKQAVISAMNVVEHKYGSKFAQVDELEKWRSEASAKELRNDFMGEFPALADKKYGKILKLVSSELADKDFGTHDEYFKALAEGAAAAIKEFDPSFDLGAKTKTTATASPKLPRTRVGGQGGSGNGGRHADPDEDQAGSLKF